MIVQQFLITFASTIFFISTLLTIQADKYPFTRDAYVYGLAADYHEREKGFYCDGITSCVESMCRIYQTDSKAAHIVFDPRREDYPGCDYPGLSTESLREDSFMIFLFVIISLLFFCMISSLPLIIKKWYRDYMVVLYIARTTSIGASIFIWLASVSGMGPHILAIRSWPYFLHMLFSILALVADAHTRKLSQTIIKDELL